ncbi:hypothetical protein [Streptomyces sp. NPDC056291]|uniref:hypothetical protein n=1 Tax=Streptomyces sp. NPDC056291 TaxID=3345772 RepID=UPI0035E23296
MLLADLAGAQLTGLRDTQCDATAVRAAPSGARAYAVLDGIGSSEAVREWTRAAARKLARVAAARGDAEAGLRQVYDAYATERGAPHPTRGPSTLPACRARAARFRAFQSYARS